jgi:hypothetical protein
MKTPGIKERLCLVWHVEEDCQLGCLTCGEDGNRFVRAFDSDRIDPPYPRASAYFWARFRGTGARSNWVV